jgi:hypothetical protein
MPKPLEFHQSFELAGKSEVTTAFRCEYALHHLANATLVEGTVDQA